jgi:hypothetical protein
MLPGQAIHLYGAEIFRDILKEKHDHSNHKDTKNSGGFESLKKPMLGIRVVFQLESSTDFRKDRIHGTECHARHL